MKILILNKWLVTGGVERVLISYIKLFKLIKYDTKVISLYDIGYTNKNLHSEIDIDTNLSFILDRNKSKKYFEAKHQRKNSLSQKIKYELLKTNYKYRINSYIHNEIKKEKYNLIIDFNNILKNTSHLQRQDIPIIKWVHSDITTNKNKAKIKNTFQSINHIIAICEQMQNNLSHFLDVPKGKISTIYNPIDITEIHRKMEAPIKITETNYFLVIARLVKGKGLEELIDIYINLKKKGIKNKLYIIGDGELRSTLSHKITQNRLENDCVLLGEVTNPYPYFKKAKLFLFTSESEGLGMVLIESMACGIPVIAMDCPTGPRDIIGLNNEYGKLIPMHNKEKFENTIIELLSDELQYQDYVEKSLSRAKDFSIENISKKIQELFNKIV